MPKALAVGDIVLTTTNEVMSGAIRTVSKSDISHAMLCVDHCSVIDATGDGVQARNTQRLFYPDTCAVYILRPRTPLSVHEIGALCAYVRSRVGTQYTKREAARLLKGGSDHWTRRQFCSRLVAQAYAAIGRPLVKDENYCWPEDFKASAQLIQVSGAIETVTAEEYDRFRAARDMTAKMRDVTTTVLEGARQKQASIEDMNDITPHLIAHPEDDAYFCDVYWNSGYLTLWREEMAENPWQYDFDTMCASGIPPTQLDEYCRRTVESTLGASERYHINKTMSFELAQRHGLETFALWHRLYDTLAENDSKRFQVAKRWQRHRAGAPAPDPLLPPHSPAWFAALEDWQPYRAMLARAAVKVMERDDVCSICGDDPAPVYRLATDPEPGEILTLRLCDDCRTIRKEAALETYERMDPAA